MSHPTVYGCWIDPEDWHYLSNSKDGFNRGAHSEANVAPHFRQWHMFDPIEFTPEQYSLPFPVDPKEIP